MLLLLAPICEFCQVQGYMPSTPLVTLIVLLTFVGNQLVADGAGIVFTQRRPQSQSDTLLKVGREHAFLWTHFNYIQLNKINRE